MKSAYKPIVAEQVLAFLLSEHATLQNGKTHLSREGKAGSSKVRPMNKKLQLYHKHQHSIRNTFLNACFFWFLTLPVLRLLGINYANLNKLRLLESKFLTFKSYHKIRIMSQ